MTARRASFPSPASSWILACVAWMTRALYPPHSPRLEVTQNRRTRFAGCSLDAQRRLRNHLGGIVGAGGCAQRLGQQPGKVRAERLCAVEAPGELHRLGLRHALHGPGDLVDVADADDPLSDLTGLGHGLERLLECRHGRGEHLGLRKRPEVPDARQYFRLLSAQPGEEPRLELPHAHHRHVVHVTRGWRRTGS